MEFIYPEIVHFPQLIWRNTKSPNGDVLSTYQISDEQFITYRNNKAIGWARTLTIALWIHKMYLDVYKERYR